MSKPTQAALAQRAARNFPESAPIQAAWLRAIAIVRASKRGWVLDSPITLDEGRARMALDDARTRPAT